MITNERESRLLATIDNSIIPLKPGEYYSLRGHIFSQPINDEKIISEDVIPESFRAFPISAVHTLELQDNPPAPPPSVEALQAEINRLKQFEKIGRNAQERIDDAVDRAGKAEFRAQSAQFKLSSAQRQVDNLQITLTDQKETIIDQKRTINGQADELARLKDTNARILEVNARLQAEVRSKPTGNSSYYRTLGIDGSVLGEMSSDEAENFINAVYRARARQMHPDVSVGREKDMKSLNAARDEALQVVKNKT